MAHDKRFEFGYYFRLDTSNEELMRAQLDSLSKQVPLMYFILSVNASILASAFHNKAPAFLSHYLPAMLICLCFIRLFVWIKRTKDLIQSPDKSSAQMIARFLKRTVVLGGVLAILFVSWALALFPHGDEAARFQILFFVGITVVSCVFCLMNLRAAALIITSIVVPVFTTFLLFSGDPSFVAIGVNLLVVAAAMVNVLINYSRNFEHMVFSRAEAQRLGDENLRLANVDSLTGLANRRQFFQKLEGLLAQTPGKNGSDVAVGVVDLDGFKPVNDLYGHLSGDRVLAETGRRLETFASASVFVARLGGDEFGVIVESPASNDAVLKFGEDLCAALRLPFDLPGVTAKISASCGFAIHQGGESDTPQEMYERADFALYQAKEHGVGGATLFSAEHMNSMRQVAVIEQKIRTADLETELSLEFQPLFDVVHGRIIAFEALARWRSAEFDNVPPDVFIPIAERTDLINAITRILLKKALKIAASWPENVRLSFNLSMRDLISPLAAMQIAGIIRESGFNPGRLDLEITETALISDFGKAREAILLFKSLGARISLDDFGTGYSSLGYVHQLPLDKIKIDGSFVHDIETSRLARDIVKTILDLCRNLSLDCVTEGVENAAQAQILRELGCTIMQGYYFGRPVHPEKIAGFVAEDQKEFASHFGQSVQKIA